MKSKLVFCLSLLILVQAVASAATITVPSRTYQTIQQGIDYARTHAGYDTVEVLPGIYSGFGNRNLDFHGAAITVRSTVNPADPCWGIIAATVIDCGGMSASPPYGASDTGLTNRAFWFHNNEGSGSQVIGFTIKNGYARGPKSADGGSTDVGYTSVWHGIPYTPAGNTAPWQTYPHWDVALGSNPSIDPCTLPPVALDGNNAIGDQYGGAILCENASSPAISYCVIENCTVTGAIGGNGAAGQSGPWYYYTWADFNWIPDTPGYKHLLDTATLKNTTNGQGGGNGGMGTGNGYGGAIAIRGTLSNPSNPAIDHCQFINNSAQGGQGGKGGRGGFAAYAPYYNSGLEGGGGDAGDSNGSGIGGAIYSETGCMPTFSNCLFENNVAKTGPRSPAGGRGQGNLNTTTVNGTTTRVSAGQSGKVYPQTKVIDFYHVPTVAGGAAYFKTISLPIFTDCNFINNKAYLAFGSDPNLYASFGTEDIMGYTVGGAIYFDAVCLIEINTCDFITNGGGALYFSSNCVSSGNTTTAISNDSAVARGQPGRKNLFQDNFAPDDFIIDTYNGSFYAVPSLGSGGAIYMNSGCDVTISNSIFNKNTAKVNGGAFETQSNLNISDCAFSDNTILGNGDFTGYGGAVDVYSGFDDLTISANNCSFTGNKSVYGGALSTDEFYGSFNNCIFAGNEAQTGGALDLEYGTVTIAESIFKDNAATGDSGGGIDCYSTSADINSCQFFNNSTAGTYAYGGGIDIEGGTGHTLRNCLFVGNSSSYNGGAVACESSVSPLIRNCTFSQDTANEAGGSIYSDWSATPTITNCIFQKSNNYAIYKDNAGGSESYCLFFNNPDGNSSGIPLGLGNLTGDPLFVTGKLGNYYLSQTPDQTINSPAVNSGNGTALAAGLSTKTTDTNDILDSGKVDMGYHFGRAVDVPQFHLTISVVGGIGTISVSPAPLSDGNYYAGTVVTVTVYPQANYIIKSWTGTDNDNSDGQTKTVTMIGNRNVTVELYTPRILYVGGDSGYPTIQAAIDEANDRDIIMLMPSDQPYFTQWGYTIIGRNITITSINPNDPTVVASTVIQQTSGANGNVSPAFQFENVGPLMRLQGITIRRFSGSGGQSLNGDPTRGYYDGLYGSTVPTMGIYCVSDASPTIQNCVIDDCHAYGGNGGNGAAGDATHPNGGNGGWPGGARGGGLSCYSNSNPTLINCTFSNNTAEGGNGGDGGNANSNPDGIGGRGGGWFYGTNNPPPSPWETQAYQTALGTLPKDFSGLGGAVYIDSGCNPTFESCTFTNNLSRGGQNGICGPNPRGSIDEPSIHYRIANLGGSVYLAEGSSADFNNCTFTVNTADTNGDPCSFDDFLGYGGAIAAENYATLTISKCRFSNNTGDIGGGVYSNLSDAEVDDCNFSGNTAFHGGGLLFSDSVAYITGSTFSGNVGSISGSEGGAISLLGSNVEVSDCNIANNQVGGSGGGIYISSNNINGNEIEGENSVLVKNCLITGNIAALDGGGISASWYSEPNIVNCTIVNNDANTGGGLFSSYGSYVNVLNSIIWDNQVSIGSSGSQIAIGGGDLPSTIQVRYSDVQDSNDPCATRDINTLDFVFCFDTTGSMGGDIDAVRTTARQIVNAITAKYADYRLGLVDFRDYPDGNHGDTGDWPYLDRVKFTKDVNQLIGGLQPMVAGGGADGPEAIYTALMHSIDANALIARLTANGDANFIETNSPGLGDWRKGKKVMRVILLLTDAPPHDPEPYTNYVLNDIVTAATGSNPIHIIPVVIRGDPTAENTLRSVAVETGGILISAADSNAVPAAVLNAIGLLSHTPAPILVETGGAINWDPNTFTWGLNSHNINADPLFVGGYFLSQIAAGQDLDSLCVNAGSADVNSPGIKLGSGYTTRTDNVADAGIVDMGYHYSAFTPPHYRLTITPGDGLTSADVTPSSGDYIWFSKVPLHVIATTPTGYQVAWTGTDNDDINDGNNSVRMTGDKTVTVGFVKNTCYLTVEVVGNIGGTVTPVSGIYDRGVSVPLTATPDSGYRVYSWQGTDNDSSYARTNAVTMNGDKTVYVTFSLPQTITVPGQYSSIQAAIEAARSGDIVSVASGVYHGSHITIDKEITIASTNPDDPCVVAATVIDSTGYADQAIIFGAGATENTVLDGFTIIGGTYNPIDRVAPTGAGANGLDGIPIGGGAMYVATGASPTVRNCVVRDTHIRGGNATNGNNADATTPAGRGGWAGGSYGGGVYVNSGANPTFINCTVTNCTAIGGNAGNGGNSSGTFGGTDYQDANHGGSWSDANTFPYTSLISSDGGPYLSDYQFYTGLGGGVFCFVGSSATFIDCNIINNTASGGMSGIGGTRPFVIPDPVTAYRIPSYGGGVFCAGASVKFIGCTITGNISPKPDTTYHTDPYLGHGGGIAMSGGVVQLENCTVNGNTSSVGGGIYWISGSPTVENCNIINNIAYVGGGIYATSSTGEIKGCSLRGNFAGASPNDVDVVAGQGGGIFGSSINVDILDCVLNSNTSSTSGAGIHIYGPASTETIIRNCLLTGNQSGRDGAGISVNWGAVAVVENCTLYNNLVTGLYGVPGDTGFGAGLYCSYGASADVNNSILWDNNSLTGCEIYIGSDSNHEPTCGSVTVEFSDIEGSQTDLNSINIGNGCPFSWGAGNMNTDPLFVNALGDDFHLKSKVAGQKANSPCIDAGGNPSQLHGLIRYSTSTLGSPDMGVVDIGYHYPVADYCRRWDLFMDEVINFRDLSIFAKSWVGQIGGTSGYNVSDLADFTDCWLTTLEKDITPPSPNPMTWEIAPRALTGSSVEMKATDAHDKGGGAVYYQFEDTNGTPSAWQVDPCYTATGVSATGEHCYRVRAKDQNNNMTAWSDYNDQTGVGCVTDIGDITAPTPAPTMIVLPSPSGDRDTNDTSEQFFWSTSELDWWHKIVVDVTGITDNLTPTSELEVRFICSNSAFSSNSIIPVTFRPIRIGHPVSIGGRIEDGVGVKSGSYRLTWNGTNRIVYDVFVDSYGGAIGVKLHWHVCVYDTSGNSVCSSTFLIPQ